MENNGLSSIDYNRIYSLYQLAIKYFHAGDFNIEIKAHQIIESLYLEIKPFRQLILEMDKVVLSCAINEYLVNNGGLDYSKGDIFEQESCIVEATHIADALVDIFKLYETKSVYILGFDNLQEVSSKDLQLDSVINLQEEHHKAKPSKRGRQTKLFDSYLFKVDLDSLHKAMEGKAGKEAALIIRTALREGLINKPTFAAVEKEFGDIGNRSGYNKYMSDQYNFTEDEVAGARKQLGLE